MSLLDVAVVRTVPVVESERTPLCQLFAQTQANKQTKI